MNTEKRRKLRRQFAAITQTGPNELEPRPYEAPRYLRGRRRGVRVRVIEFFENRRMLDRVFSRRGSRKSSRAVKPETLAWIRQTENELRNRLPVLGNFPAHMLAS